MGLSSDVMRALVAAGASVEMLLAAAEAAEAAEKVKQAEAEDAAERRRERAREGNRIRQARYYDRHCRDNGDNAVRRREEREDQAEQRSPTPPKTTPEDITPPLPSEATAPLPVKRRRFDWPSDFEERFWDAYPRHTDRKKAMVSLNRVRRADKVDFAEIIAGCHRLRASGTEVGFLPHATTWLNNERWTDELPPAPSHRARASPARATTADFWAGDAVTANDELTGGGRGKHPFGTENGQRGRGGAAAHGRPDWDAPQQAGTDPRQLPPLRLVSQG